MTWDDIRATPTVIEVTGMNGGVHESVMRSFHILGAVKTMLDRGDSAATVREFIAWAEQQNDNEGGEPREP